MSFLDDYNNRPDIQPQAAPVYKAPAPAPTPAPQKQGLLGKVGNFVKAVGHGLAQPFEDVGQGIGAALASKDVLKQSEYANKQASQTMDEASKLYKSGKLSGDKYRQILQGVNESLASNSANLHQINDQVSAKKVLAGGAQLATYALAPELGALKPAAALLPKIGANAALGGAIAGESSIENNGSARDVAKDILLGGAVGGATGGASGILRNVLSRRAGAGVAPVAAETPTLAPPPVATAPKVVTHAGPTVITPPASAPAPVKAATKALDVYDNTNSYINPQQPTAPDLTPPITMSAGALGAAPDSDLAILNYLQNARARAPQAAAGGRVGMPTPELSANQNQLFQELQAKTNKVLQPKTDASLLHAPQPQPASVLPRPAAPTLPEAGAPRPVLPEGYTSTNGSVFGPSGKELTIGEQQALTQPKYLTDFENAHNAGDTAAMQRIAAAHPGDAKVNAPELFPNGQIGEAAPELGGNLLQRVGRGVQRAGVKVDTKASVFGARREAELQQFMRSEGLLKAGSNPETMYKQLPTKMANFQTQISKLIASDKSVVPVADLKAEIKSAVAKNSVVRGTGRKSLEIVNNINKIIDSTAPDGKLTPAQIYQIKQTLNTDLDNAYKRLEKGGALSEADQTSMAARDVVNNKLPAAARALGKKESSLHDLAAILDKDRKAGLRIPNALAFGLPHARQSRGLAHAMASAETAIGVPIESLGNAAASIKSGASGMLGRVADRVPSQVTDTLGAVSPELSPLAAMGAVNMPPEQPAPQQPQAQPDTAQTSSLTDMVSQVQGERASGQAPATPQPTNEFGLTSADIQKAMLEDLLTTGGTNNAVLSKIYSIVQAQEKAQETANQPQTLSQTAVNQINTIQRAQSGLDQIEAAFQGTTNTGKGLLSKVQASPVGNFTGGRGVQDVNKTIQANLTSIASALGMGTSSRELEALAAQLPNTQDTQKSAQAKLGVIRGQINQYLNQYVTNQSNFVQPGNQALDSLAQISSGGIPQ